VVVGTGQLSLQPSDLVLQFVDHAHLRVLILGWDVGDEAGLCRVVERRHILLKEGIRW